MSDKRYLIHFLILLGLSTSLPGCEFGKSTYGGTKSYSSTSSASSDSIAQALIASTVNMFQIDSSTAQVSGSDITKFVNKVTTFSVGVTAPLDLTPDASMVTTRSGTTIRVAPGVSDAQFVSPLDKSITLPAASIVAVMNLASQGDVVSFNAFDRQSQSFSLRFDGSIAKGIFYSSGTDYISAPLTVGSGWGIVAASFNSEGGIDFSVNGKLNYSPTSTGSPGTPFSVPRVMTLGPASTGDYFEFKEVYVFGRALTRTEHGALVSYLAKKNSITVSLDPLLGVSTGGGSGGTTTDSNFAPAQAVIESKCISCHSSWSGVKASYYTGVGLVTKGNPTGSKLYYRLSGSSGASGPKNMPQSGSISAGDVTKIETWIQNMP